MFKKKKKKIEEEKKDLRKLNKLRSFFKLVQQYSLRRKEGNVLFNDALNTIYLCLCSFEHMVKDHSESERGNLRPPLHRLFFSISNKGSFICTILQTFHGLCYTSRGALAGTRNSSMVPP